MGKPNIDGSFGKKSNLDIHPSQLDEKTFRHALNANMESRDGSSFTLTNEQSNILCSLFKGDSNYKVINSLNDINENRTFFFLANPITGCSEIGYIQNNEDVNDLDDIDRVCGCNMSKLLATPLEDLIQTPTCEYKTLISDCCEELESNMCLNFNISNPISSVIQNELCGTTLYFTDGKEDIRRLEVDNLDQYTYIEQNCEDDEEGCDCGKIKVEVCLDCEKLKIYRSFSNPCIEASVVNGGNLKHSSNVFYFAYCDEIGNTLSRFSSITGEVPINDPTKKIYTQPELDALTNLSISLKLTNVDIEAPYYKIVVEQTSALDSSVRYFQVGIYPTSQTELLFSDTTTLRNSSYDEVTAQLPLYKTAKTVSTANNRLFINDLTAQPEINLQPVVNLMGQFAEWKTYIAEEDIYDIPEFVEKYRGYMRNEVYPFSIRFGTNNYVTANFPLISRVATDEDKFFEGNTEPIDPQQIIVKGDSEETLSPYETDIYSVLKNSEVNCGDYPRIYKWQYYNTAEKEFTCTDNVHECSTIEPEIVEETQARDCETIYDVGSGLTPPNVDCAPPFEVTIEGDELEDYVFTTVDQFIKDFGDLIAEDEAGGCFALQYNNIYKEQECCNGNELFGLDEFGESLQDENGCPISSCSDVEFSGSETKFIRINNDTGTYTNVLIIYKDCNFYTRNAAPESCNIYEAGSGTGNLNINTCCDDCKRFRCRNNDNRCDGDDQNEPCCEWDFVRVVDSSCHPRNPVWERGESLFGGQRCDQAEEIPFDSPYEAPTHLVPFYAEGVDEMELQEFLAPSTNPTSVSASTILGYSPELNTIRKRCRGNGIDNEDGEFLNRIHENALWFSIPNIENGVVLNISDLENCPTSKKKKDCLLYSSGSDTEAQLNSAMYRYTLYNGCGDPDNPVYVGFTGHIYTCNKGGLLSPTGATLFQNIIYLYSYTGGTTIESEANQIYTNVEQSLTTGSGSGATFNITRDGEGAISSVQIVLRGYNYAAVEVLTIFGSDIGGADGFDDISVTVDTTTNDESYVDDDGHILLLSPDLTKQLFPDGIIIAFDAPITPTDAWTGIPQNSECEKGVIDAGGFTYSPITDPTLTAGTYSDLSAQGGQGVGSLWDVVVDGAGVVTLTLVAGGFNYEVGDTLLISSEQFGGSAPFFNLTISVTSTTTDGEGDSCDEAFFGYVTGTCGCFSISAYTPQIHSVKIESDRNFTWSKTCSFEATCDTALYENLRCDPQEWSKGKFAYWESTENYPDNQELYNSSELRVPFNLIPNQIRDEFEEVFTFGVDQNQVYALNPDTTNFACTPIRHFKFPDNAVSPYQDGLMTSNGLTPFSKNRVFPLGISISKDVINAFLDVAVENGIITEEFRNQIEYYELFRGKVGTHKSILGKGIMFDGWEYDEQGEPNQFANFPFNDNRTNKLLYKEKSLREEFIEHPDPDFKSNNKYFFHSPEFSFEKPIVPFEMEVESYLFGQSRGYFAEVENHPKMIILSSKAYRVARILGGIQSALEIITDLTDRGLATADSSFFGVFSTNWGSGFAWAQYITYSVQRVATEALIGGRQKVDAWLEIFTNNGKLDNFASYYVAQGYYNKIAFPNQYGNKLRGIADGRYLNNARYSYNVNTYRPNTPPLNLKVNHYNRVSSLLLYLGGVENDTPFNLQVDQSYYRDYDNSRITNKPCININEDDRVISPLLQRNIQSPYVSLKIYSPSQYGAIDNVEWISTNYCGLLNVDEECNNTAFGGDIFISRFAFKRHFPFFINPMISPQGTLADLTSFSYTRERNVGVPRYYVNYLINPSQSYDRGIILPRIESFYNFDCSTEKKLYVTPPSTFYLWHYGIPNFLVESRINLNYRYGANNRDRDFFPNQSDIVQWTQEQYVSNEVDNYYYYSYAYSSENDQYPYRRLPQNYNKKEWDCKFLHDDRTAYSLQDSKEKDGISNWKVFLANNFNDFGDKYGKFIGLKNIESEKVIGRFENGMVIFNAFNTIQGTVEDVQVGTGGIFATRATEFTKSDLGYGGTQHQAWVSCEFGHFWVDAKRGRIHQTSPNGGDLKDITVDGWKNWFRENLPFKLKSQFPDIPLEVLDNAYNGAGIAMTWDDRYSRLFVTKKDYVVKDDAECCIEYDEELGFVNNLTECSPEEYPQVPTCPDGYVLNEELQTCEKILIVPPTVECKYEFDLMLSIDISDSVSEEEMTDQKLFITTLLDTYLRTYIELGDVAVGFTTWNSTVQHIQPIITGVGATDILLTAVANDIPSDGLGSTNLNAGFCACLTEFDNTGRVGYTKQIMTLTDGFTTSQYSCTGYPSDFTINQPFTTPSTLAQEETRDTLERLGYISKVIGISPQSLIPPASALSPWTTVGEVLNTWNILHTSDVNGGDAYYSNSFSDLLTPEFIESIFEGSCVEVLSCPNGFTLDGDNCEFTDSVNPTYVDQLEQVDFDNDCFEECSWTAAYSPMYETWIGNYDFLPNYYVPHTNYFQAGKNTDNDEYGIWSHLLTKKSFQVFFGKRYPWIIELPIKDAYFNKRHGAVAYWLDVKRFHTEFDFAENRNNGFDHAIIYNHDENTGMLNLIRGEKNNLHQLQKYPKHNNDSTDILAIQEQRKWTFNYIFDMVKDKYNNVPIWLNDCPNVHKVLNPKAFDYRPTIKNNLRGDWFLIRMIQESDSQHQYTFKWLTSRNDIYER